MAPPVLLLDIDGVLNAISPDLSAPWPNESWVRFHATDIDGGEWRMQIAKDVVTYLSELHSSGRAEIRWHTTWQEAALDIGDEVGLPTFHVVDAPENNWNPIQMRRQWWKVPAALRVVNDEGRRLIWVDDDIAFFLHPRDRAEFRGRCHFVSPATKWGLTPRDLVLIDRALKDLESEDAASAEPAGDSPAAAASAA